VGRTVSRHPDLPNAGAVGEAVEAEIDFVELMVSLIKRSTGSRPCWSREMKRGMSRRGTQEPI
jgi:hypothetical protein